MLKLKIINKPKMIKMKCNIEFPDVILAKLQEKEATPTKEMQQIIADQQYDGLSKVVVNAIPDEYIIPNGELEITQNGLHNVKDKEFANVNIPEKVLGTKTITTNGTYKATDDNVDGYSEVVVSTSGVDINDYYDLTKRKKGDLKNYIKQIPLIDTSDSTTMSYMFSGCSSLETIPLLNTSKVTRMSSMFYDCLSLTTISQLDTSKVIDMSNMFSGCKVLASIPQLDTSKVTNIGRMFNGCKSLTNLGGFTNLGKAYETTQSANYSSYTLNLSSSSKLTEQSIINVLNNLYDIATKGCKTQTVQLGSTNLAKLTSEEGQQALANAQNKGWNVS